MTDTKLNELQIFFDESGNTEEGIYDENQLFLTIASVLAPEDICKKTIKKFFPKSKANEIHYKNIKNKNSDDFFVELLIDIKKSGGSFKLYTTYKPLFMFHSLLTSLYEDEMEHMGNYHLSGELNNMYERMHYYWFVLILTTGKDYLVKLIVTYYDFAKNLDEGRFNKLYDICKSFKKHELIGYIFNSLERRKFSRTKELFESYGSSMIDPAFAMTFDLLNTWSADIDQDFTVVYDNSKSLERKKEIFNYFKRDKNFIKPLRIQSRIDPNTQWVISPGLNLKEELQFKDSKNSYEIQVADILAGFINDIMNRKRPSDVFDKLSIAVDSKDYKHMFPNFNVASRIDPMHLFGPIFSEANNLLKDEFREAIKELKSDK